jgi:hypothetical protein
MLPPAPAEQDRYAASCLGGVLMIYQFRRYIIIAILLVPCGFGGVSLGHSILAQEKIGFGTKVVLITKGPILQVSNPSSGDEAILITDKSEIEKLVGLFEGNHRARHACSFHWDIWFWRSPTESYLLPFNEECEKYSSNSSLIHSTLKIYSSKLRQNPPHFVANVKVSASLTPEALTQRLEDDGKQVFFLRGTDERLPSITIQSTAISDIPDSKKLWDMAKEKNERKAKQVLREAVSKIKAMYPVTKNTDFDRRYSSFGGGKIEDRVQTTIYFPYDTKLDEIGRALENVKLLKCKIPDSYFVQLISKERLTPEQKRLIMVANPFVMAILEYPRTQ